MMHITQFVTPFYHGLIYRERVFRFPTVEMALDYRGVILNALQPETIH